MTAASLVKTARKFAIDNSPQLLTAVGVVGTVSTAVLTGKAAVKAHVLLEREGYIEATPKGYILETWKLYVPAVGTGALTIAAIVGANHIGTRRAAGLVAAYSLSEKAFDEYREKVLEKMGAKPERELRDELAQDRVNRTPGSSEVIVMGTEVLCFDTYSGRYFKSDMESLKKAMNDVNYQINNGTYATLTDFYNKIGLERTQFSDELGWCHVELLELEFSTTMSHDQRPCISISFRTQPVRDYYQFH